MEIIFFILGSSVNKNEFVDAIIVSLFIHDVNTFFAFLPFVAYNIRLFALFVHFVAK